MRGTCLKVKKIIGKKNCVECIKARKQYPNAIYVDYDEMHQHKRKEILEFAAKNNITAFPILLDINCDVIK